MRSTANLRPWRRITARVAAAFAVLITLISVTATPAHAWPAQVQGGDLAGPEGGKLRAYVHNTWTISDDSNHIDVDSVVEFQSGFVTSATDCRVTVYVTLMDPDGNQWKSGKTVRDCTYALHRRNSRYMNDHFVSDTRAAFWRGHISVDMDFNNSGTSGWQRCYVGHFMAA